MRGQSDGTHVRPEVGDPADECELSAGRVPRGYGTVAGSGADPVLVCRAFVQEATGTQVEEADELVLVHPPRSQGICP